MAVQQSGPQRGNRKTVRRTGRELLPRPEGRHRPAYLNVPLHVREEAAKASALIKRIREIQGL